MADVVLGIHGLANKPEKPTLSAWWEAAIREGLDKNCGVQNADFQYIMVYWADLLYRHPQHQNPDFSSDSLYNDQPYVAAAPGALRKYSEGWMDEACEAITDFGEAVLDKIRGYMGLDEASDRLLEQKLRDLAFYYDENRRLTDRIGQQRQARQVLMDELMNTLLPLTGRRIMLIAHSTGSIVGYDVLRNLGLQDNSFEVHHFVTIGSPLGLPQVKSNIYSERSYATVPVRTPTVVTERWMNFSDRRDPVTIDPHLGDDFGANDLGIRVEDDLVLNDYVAPNGEHKPHNSYGYLRTPELSEHISNFLQS